MKLSVDVISDVVCPWCYIGKRRLEMAIAAAEVQVSVRWHPFQLNPTMPKEGISRKEYRTRKFGSWERSRELDAKVITVGEAEGIHFAFDICFGTLYYFGVNNFEMRTELISDG